MIDRFDRQRTVGGHAFVFGASPESVDAEDRIARFETRHAAAYGFHLAGEFLP